MRGKAIRICGWALGLILSAGLRAAAQPAQPTEAQQAEIVKGLVDQAWSELKKFQKSGGKPDDSAHPATKWANVLWDYREKHPGTPPAALATREAIHLLVHAGRFGDVRARVDSLASDDPAWPKLVDVLFEAAENSKDYARFIAKAKPLAASGDSVFCAHVHYLLGRAYEEKIEYDLAKKSYETAIEIAPGSEHAKRAERQIYEVTHLRIGQPAPEFRSKATNGSTVALASLKGSVVLLKFWATW